MIRGVIFDFGGVLVRTLDPAGRREWEARLGLASGELERVVHNSDIWIAAQRGSISPEAYWRAVAERIGLPEADIPALRADYFRDDALNRDLIELIRVLRNSGYRVGLLSNDAITLDHKLRHELQIHDAFDAVVISAQLGVMKPEPAAYHAIAQSLSLSTPECVFIDDNTANVDGAHAVGMAAILYRPGIDLREALERTIQSRAAPTEAIIFDWGNVLDIPEDWEAWTAWRDRLAEPYGRTGEDLSALLYRSEPWHEVKKGLISYEKYLEAIFAPLGITDPAAQRALVDAYHKRRDRVHPEMLALLEALRGRYRLALLSNAWQRDMERWLEEERGVGHFFEVVVSSAAVGMAKPEPGIYALILERLALRPEQVIFIDDLRRNTMASEALGIPSIVFESPGHLRQALIRRGILPAPSTPPVSSA